MNDGVSPATSATVTGLTNDARYVFHVAAVNAAGTGDPANDSPTFMPAAFGGFSAFSAPTQIVAGSPDMISGRVADPAGDCVDAIRVYRDLDGNGILDPGSDQLLLADTTPADGYAFDAGSLPSGRHVLHVAAIKAGAVAGSITTLAAARWWIVSIGETKGKQKGNKRTGMIVPIRRSETAARAGRTPRLNWLHQATSSCRSLSAARRFLFRRPLTRPPPGYRTLLPAARSPACGRPASVRPASHQDLHHVSPPSRAGSPIHALRAAVLRAA